MVARWNFHARTSGQPSVASTRWSTRSTTIFPLDYRDVIKQSLLQWHAAFEMVGILNAIQVQQQPNDPSFDVDESEQHGQLGELDLGRSRR